MSRRVWLVLTTLLLASLPATSGATQHERRLAGAGRYDTAAAIATAAFPDGADVVYLARGREPLVDALAGGALTDGPVLLVPPGTGPQPSAVRSAVSRLGASRVVALGGTSAVSTTMLRAVADGRPTGRLSGDSRYETAAAIATAAFPDGANVVYVARGQDPLVDALAGGALTDGPVLLVPPGNGPPPAAVRSAADRLGAARVVALGGPAAVSGAMLSAVADGRGTGRLAGGSRYETAAAIATAAFPNGSDVVYLARGQDPLVDALAGGALTDGPVLLVPPGPGTPPDAVLAAVQALGATRVVALGGTAAIADAMLAAVADAVTTPAGADDDVLALLRRNNLFRVPNEGPSTCEDGGPDRPVAGDAWARFDRPAAGGDLLRFCAAFAPGTDEWTLELTGPSGAVAATAALRAEAQQPVFSTDDDRDGLALLATVRHDDRLRWVGLVETWGTAFTPGAEEGERPTIVQLHALVDNERPAGEWTATLSSATERVAATVALDAPCATTAPQVYTGRPPLALGPDLRTGRLEDFDIEGGTITSAENCRLAPDVAGLDREAAEATLEAFYDRWQVDATYADGLGDCGDQAGLVQQQFPTWGTWPVVSFVQPIQVDLLLSFTCPPAPDVIGLPWADAEARLVELATEHEHWRFRTSDPTGCDRPGAAEGARTVSMFRDGVQPGDVVAVLDVACDAARVSGRVARDVDGDGVADPEDVGHWRLTGQVQVLDQADAVVDETRVFSSSAGRFTFHVPAPGTYDVVFTPDPFSLPDDAVATTPERVEDLDLAAGDVVDGIFFGYQFADG